MKIDILIPFHRNDGYLRESIASIERSKSVETRIILIDDRPSFDESSISDLNFDVYIKSDGVGYSRALRIGLDHVTADFFAMQDSDDLSEPQRLFTQLAEIQDKQAQISVCGLVRVNESGKKYLLQSPHLLDEKLHKLSNLLGSYNSNSSWVCKSEILENSEVFPKGFRSIDWATTLQLPNHLKVAINPTRLYRYRQHKNQMTRHSEYKGEAFSEIYELWKMLNDESQLPPLNYWEASMIAAPWVFTKQSPDKVLVEIERLQDWILAFLNFPQVKLSEDKNRFKSLLIRKVIQGKYLFNLKTISRLISKIQLS